MPGDRRGCGTLDRAEAGAEAEERSARGTTSGMLGAEASEGTRLT